MNIETADAPSRHEALLQHLPSIGRSTAAIGIVTALVAMAKSPATKAESVHMDSKAVLSSGPDSVNGCNALLNDEVSDPLHAVRDKVVDVHGKQYMPVGVSIYGGLQQWNGLTTHVEEAVTAQIKAAIKYYRANTIRLQVSQALYSQDPEGFMQELDREDDLATCLGAMVDVNDNTLFTSNQPAPDSSTLKFVSVLARHFAGKNNTFIDPFNEPRLLDNASPEQMWRVWQKGGTVDGVRYVGMQALISAIRQAGNHNLIWLEGPHWASDFSLLKQYPVKGDNIMLEFHHPKLNEPYTWQSLLHVTDDRPEVEGEESEYSSSTRPECYSSAYTNMPKLLNMLTKYHDGLVNWALEPGVDVKSSSQVPVSDIITAQSPTNPVALSHPSTINKNYSCTRQGQGMGKLFMNFSKDYSARYNPYSSFVSHK